ncbi:phage tail assembly protein T [Pseudomonas umsongensis]|uniref:phage tail assembly protein T n=1 Tax=Pseudomonas umsongensis TaxID=198618 RepID=UPI003F718F0D
MREFRSWAKFRDLRGSLHAGMRVERGFALLASIMANKDRDPKKRPEPFSIYDFMPHDSQKPITLEQALQSWA